MNCPFCEIVGAKRPSWKVYEDELTVAFLDKAQATRGHTLVVPKRHAEDIWSLAEEEAAVECDRFIEWRGCFSADLLRRA